MATRMRRAMPRERRRPGTSQSARPLIDPEQLADHVRARRRAEGLSIRQAAKVIGISAPTLSRVERGDYLPERDTLFKLARWVEMPIDEALDLPSQEERNRLVHSPGASTLEAIELHLRADKELSREDAGALAEMFRVAYEHLRTTREHQRGRGR